ncbi:MAG TPA: histidine kinase [Candidatus Limnocylindrales bacterium]
MIRAIRLLREHPQWLDTAMALALSVIAIWLAFRTGSDHGTGAIEQNPVRETSPGRPDPPQPEPQSAIDPWLRPLGVAGVSLFITGPLAWRRRWPILVFLTQVGAAMLVGAAGSARVIFVSVVIGAYSCVVHARPAWLTIGIIVAVCVATMLIYSEVAPPVPDWATSFAIFMPIALFGLAIRSARERANALAERADALAERADALAERADALAEREEAQRRGQEAATAAAVAQERAAIARELHDVVSHHVSVMVIQAGAAEKVMANNPVRAGEALRAIAGSGREAMGELRNLLGVLTPPSEEGAATPLQPQPGLGQLEALVAKVRAAGQPVDLECQAPRLPQSVDTAAYHVVREALTNALRYAPGARTVVRVRTDGENLTVEVTDDGAPDAVLAGIGRGTGTGLVGLTERLALLGGTLKAGRRLTGGFRVSAHIPLAGGAS